MRGKIIIIVAPSGAGKSTLIKRIEKEFDNLEWSVSCTTRPMREGETHGKEYFFISEEEFKKMIDEDAFAEWAEVHKNYYGTSKEFVENGLSNGKFLLFDIDVQGCDLIKKAYPHDTEIIFIAPPSIEELEKRLRGRGTESEETINIRITNAKSELARKDDFDYLVINDDLEVAYQNLSTIFKKITKRD